MTENPITVTEETWPSGDSFLEVSVGGVVVARVLVTERGLTLGYAKNSKVYPTVQAAARAEMQQSIAGAERALEIERRRMALVDEWHKRGEE